MKFPWKVKGTCENKVRGGCGSYHSACADRHLESHLNETGRNLIKERLLKKVQNELNMKKMLQ